MIIRYWLVWSHPVYGHTRYWVYEKIQTNCWKYSKMACCYWYFSVERASMWSGIFKVCFVLRQGSVLSLL